MDSQISFFKTSGVSELLLFEEQEHEDGVAMWTGACMVVKESPITIQGSDSPVEFPPGGIFVYRNVS